MRSVPYLKLVVFTLDDQQYALHLSAVERIVLAVEVTPLPKGPEIVIGVINVQGRIIPVFNIRKRFRLPEHEIELSDQFIIAHTSKRTVALVADRVKDIFDRSDQEIISAEEIVPGIEYVKGVVKLEDGLVLIHDLDTFLSLQEEIALDKALSGMVEGEK
jgi:purine-binding chemotaxis protein CheW